MGEMTLAIPRPSEKQERFLEARAKYIAFGGARGGGKSWAVRTKAKLLALHYAGIRLLIVRRSYPELTNNHISILRGELVPTGVARYNDKDKCMSFRNGSTIHFMYCARDADLDRLQGVEYDCIFLDEATQLSEWQMTAITACLRGANSFPKRVYFTCNPGGQGHGYIKRLFIDRRFEAEENPDDYVFIQALATDNRALMEAQPDYIGQLEALPPKMRDAWLYGRWDIFEGQFFEDLRIEPDTAAARAAGCDMEPDELREAHRWCHVIPPFAIPRGWNIMRSYDFGFARPFSMAWWAVDYDGVLYRILEAYGCTRTPDEGVKWTPDEQFRYFAELEREHPLLAGREITDSVADPAIWDASRGESIAETAARYGIYFTPGDNKRIPGWMQVHYRLQFDADGYARMYVFDTCKAFIRTMPLMMYSERRPEDLNTSLEDHAADEVRYMCMSRPVAPVLRQASKIIRSDPLNQYTNGQEVSI